MLTPTSFLYIVIFLSLAFGAAAQPVVDTTGGSPHSAFAFINVATVPTGSIAGKVVNDPNTGERPEGVAGVRILLRPLDEAQGANIQHQISGPAGHFNFEALSVGRYVVTVDTVSLPGRFHIWRSNEWTVDVKAHTPAAVDIPVIAERTISGTVFVDKDGNGEYKPGKDTPVAGALITAGGDFAISRADGSYSVRGLPAGRLAMLVEWPGRNDRTQVLLYLPNGPVKNRVVNIARER